MKKNIVRVLACVVFTFGLFAGQVNAQVYIKPSDLGFTNGDTGINGTFDVSNITGIPGLTLTITNGNAFPRNQIDGWAVGQPIGNTTFSFNQTIDVELAHGPTIYPGETDIWTSNGSISAQLTPLDNGLIDSGSGLVGSITNTTQDILLNSAGHFVWAATGSNFEASATYGPTGDAFVRLGVVVPEPSTALLMTLAGGFFAFRRRR